jgi:2-dehydropantoate 2-reductase
MKVCVIGAGAMGSTFGGLLARAGHEVTFVDTWPEHVAAVNARGLRLDGVKGELEIPAKVFPEPPRGLAADLAMIWTDANNTRRAADTAAAALAPDGFAVTLRTALATSRRWSRSSASRASPPAPACAAPRCAAPATPASPTWA